jgi:hypothetical protein
VLLMLIASVCLASCVNGSAAPSLGRRSAESTSAVAPSDVRHESPTSVATGLLSMSPLLPSAHPAASAQPSPPVALEPGSWAVTLSDTLRVRSQPGVSEDSMMYQPLLRKGTNFSIVRGPTTGSGYWWYDVELAPGILDGGIRRGWVAAGDRDGTPWIAGAPID